MQGLPLATCPILLSILRTGVRALLCAVLMILAGGLQASAAQTGGGGPETPPAQVQELLKLLQDPSVRDWIGKALDKPPSAGDAGTTSASLSDLADDRLSRTRRHIQTRLQAIPDLPAQFRATMARLSAELADYGLVRMLILFTLFVGLGFGLQSLFWHATKPVRSHIMQMPFQTAGERLHVTLARFGYGLSVVSIFALGSIGAFLAFDWPPLVRTLLLSYLLAFLAMRVAVVLGRFVLAPGAERFRIMPMDEAQALFWYIRLTACVGLFAFGHMTLDLMALLGFTEPERDVIAYALGFGVLALAIEASWRVPNYSAVSTSETARFAQRVSARWLETLYFVLLWVLWVIGAMPLFWLGLVSGAVPLLLRLVERSVVHILRPSEATPPGRLKSSIPAALLGRGARAGIIVASAIFLAHMWNVDLIELSGRDTLPIRILRGILNGVVILLIADMIWSVVKVVIDRKISTGSKNAPPDTEEGRREQRLRTLLPIARNFLFAIMLVVTLLMVLSALGVDIGPLVAGAGVFGVAIGFGAQTLVKDIISGVFYLLDDAFRVGEYIQSGSYKGTVESFSLRSVKLRHHRGPLYTVPFGQLGAVQNMSRDWVIDKLTVSVTYDTNLEQVRKLIKEIGKQLAADPELGPHLLENLKMQGVEQFGDYAIQIRLKMMTRPGEQFVIRRRAYALIKQAFDANGIHFAFPTVQIAGGVDATATAAAQHEVARLKAVEPTVP